MAYQYAQGHDNSGGLLVVAPQPKSAGVQYPRRLVGCDLSAIDDGTPFVEWVYTVLTPDEFVDLNTTFGLDSATSVLCTIQTLDADRTEIVRNGVIHRPENGRTARYEGGFWRGVTYRILGLEAL